MEMFHDRGTNQLLYVCESASVALASAPGALVTNKGPKWNHAMEPKVRAPEQDKFENAKKFGVEVFKDENTGGLIYITEVGDRHGDEFRPTPDPKKLEAPKTQYGLVLRVRGSDEPNFTEKTKQIGVEVFEDPNSKLLFYITETGSVATAPRPGKYVTDAKGVNWKMRDGPPCPQGWSGELLTSAEVRDRSVRRQPHGQLCCSSAKPRDRRAAEVMQGVGQ